MESSERKTPEKHSNEWQPPEIRDLTPEEEARLDRMHEEVGRMFYGEKWPEIRERWRKLNGGRG